MRKFLKPKEILLLGLANLLDVAEEIKDPFRLMSSSYKNMYGWVPTKYRKHKFYQLVSRSLKTRFIEKIEKDGEIYIRITSEGQKTIQRDFPMLLLQNRKWDKKWRIVMFDVEEINKKIRDRLRRKLKELGFGMLQKSVFISPHDIVKDFSEFAEAAGINDYLYLLETHNLIIGDEREFANKVWMLEELNKKYKDVIDEIDKIKNSHMISNIDRVKKSDGKKEEEMRKVRAKWLMIVIIDPFLPKMFLPEPCYGDKAEKSVRRLTL
jgi:phenylacetic acid degradation operon negative regulatory protein